MILNFPQICPGGSPLSRFMCHFDKFPYVFVRACLPLGTVRCSKFLDVLTLELVLRPRIPGLLCWDWKLRSGLWICSLALSCHCFQVFSFASYWNICTLEIMSRYWYALQFQSNPTESFLAFSVHPNENPDFQNISILPHLHNPVSHRKESQNCYEKHT